MNHPATVRPESIDRHLYVGASDARRIVENDWLTLYNEKVGLTPPVDLSNVFRVQLGIHTEHFHMDWLERQHDCTIARRGESFAHPDHDWMRCHIDGWHTGVSLPVEVKHSNGRATVRDRATYYMAQLQHIMAVTDTQGIRFSVIAGNDDPDWCLVERSDSYIADLIALEQGFWWHVENLVPPEITPTGTQAQLKVVAATIPIDGLKPYDMSKSNHWAALAVDYQQHAEAAVIYEAAKKGLKDLVPEDASEAAGHGIVIKRDRRGSLRFVS